MTPFPNLSSMLPSQAREALTDYFFQRFKEAGLNYTANPRFSRLVALDEAEAHGGDYAHTIANPCYDEALERFNKNYPLCWDAENQRAFRKGF